MKKVIILFLSLFHIINLSAQCNDGLTNHTEYLEDCGGLFCDANCAVEPNSPFIQRHFYHKQISFVEPHFEIGNIAVSDNGNFMIWSYWDIISGDRRVYAKAIYGNDIPYLVHEKQAGDGTLSTAYVDISDDGSRILFSYGSKIYVSDLSGVSKLMVLEKVATSAGLWDLSLKSPPQFAPGNIPNTLYFVQVEFGGTNGTGPLAAGLWSTQTNMLTNGVQIFNAGDVAMLYGEDASSYTPTDGVYGPLVSNNDEFLFGTRDYSESGYSDLWLYDDGDFVEITNYGPPGQTFSAAFNQMDMSSDGSTICWMNGEDHSYNTLNRFTGLTNKFIELGLGNDNLSFNFTGAIRTNHDGTLFFLQGSSSYSYNTALVTYNGKVHYPLAISKFSGAPTQKVSYIEMKKGTGDMIYYSQQAGNIWMSEFEKYIFQDFHPNISESDIRHTLKEHYDGPPYNKMSVYASTDHPQAAGVDYVTFLELDDPLRPINHLNNASSSQLYDDGSTYGDLAIDGKFSSNYVWPTNEVYNSPAEDTITLRIVAGNDTHISSIDVYPFYILDEPLSTNTITIKNASFKIYPTVVDNELWIDLKDQNIPDISQIFINDQLGRNLMQIPKELNNEHSIKVNLSNLNSGMYFISIALADRLITKKFIKPN